jgi:predicted molibdopterin-dependent oxidoreductase YjgC
MLSMLDWLSKWPVVRQICECKDGIGLEAMSEKTRAMHARTDDAQVARSICPYCGVGCGQLIYHKNGKLISIEGDPESPISQGEPLPKGRCVVSIAHALEKICRTARQTPSYLKSAGNFRSVVQIPHASGMPTMSQ